MLEVTTRAKKELHGMLLRALSEIPDDGEQLAFRLVAQEDGAGPGVELGLALDAPRQGDEVLEHDGRSVLIVEAPVSNLLGHLTLDVIETSDGLGLGLRE